MAPEIKNEPAYFGINKAAVTAWVNLSNGMDEHKVFPCKDNPAPYVDDEIYDLETDAYEELCYGCPLLKLCYDFATLNDEKHGVWGGVNFGSEDNKKNGKLF